MRSCLSHSHCVRRLGLYLLIVPPRVVWNSRRDSRKRLCFIHITVKNSLGFTLQDCNRVKEHTRFLLLTRSTSVEGCCRGLKEKRERSQSVPLTLSASYSLFLRTGQSSGSSGTARAQQLLQLRLQLILASRSPTLRPSAARLLFCHSTGRQPRANS